MATSLIHSIKRLLKTKYNGSRVVIKNPIVEGGLRVIEIYVMIPEEYIENTSDIQEEIFNITNSDFIEVIPMINVEI